MLCRNLLHSRNLIDCLESRVNVFEDFGEDRGMPKPLMQIR